jgi:hypothetical protein
MPLLNRGQPDLDLSIHEEDLWPVYWTQLTSVPNWWVRTG